MLRRVVIDVVRDANQGGRLGSHPGGVLPMLEGPALFYLLAEEAEESSPGKRLSDFAKI